MNEIQKYKKARLIFQIAGFVSAIAILAYLLVVVLTNSEFNTDCIVAVSILGGYTLAMIICFVVFDKRRRQLVEKYFGKVSDEDVEKSKVLLGQVDVFMRGEYSFLTDGQFDLDEKTLKYCLKQISKGHKIYLPLASVVLDIQKEIEKSPEKDLAENKEYNSYINQLTELFERNKSEI